MLLASPNKPCWPFALNRGSPQTRGLVAYYPGYPGHGQLFDCRGKGRHGILTASPTWDMGKDGGKAALKFVRASSQYVTVPEISLSTVHSFMFWVRFDVSTVLGWSILGGNIGARYFCNVTTSDRKFYYYDGSNFHDSSGTDFLSADLGVFHHFGVVRNGSTVSLYRDGILMGSGSGLVANNAMSFKYIGTREILDEFGSGAVESLAVYNRALTASQVYSHYDPKTRWDLRYQPGRRRWFIPAAIGSSFVRVTGVASGSSSCSAVVKSTAKVAGVSQSLGSIEVGLAESVSSVIGSAEGSSQATGVVEALAEVTGSAAGSSQAEGVIAATKEVVGVSAGQAEAHATAIAFRELTGNLPFTSIFLREDKAWQFSWKNTGVAYYRILLYGMEIGRVFDNSEETITYVCTLSGYEDFPPFIEVAEEETKSFNENNLPFIQIQWYAVQTAAYYTVSQLVDGNWEERFQAQERGDTWVYTYQSANLADDELHQFKVESFDMIGQDSTDVEFRKFMIRVPVLDPRTIEVGYESPNLVITAT